MNHPFLLDRRQWLHGAGLGLGALALADIVHPGALQDPVPHGGLHLAPKAKRVIYLFQSGGPSQFETFDPKPKLAAMHGQPMPDSFTKGKQIAQLQGQKLVCYGPQTK